MGKLTMDPSRRTVHILNTSKRCQKKKKKLGMALQKFVYKKSEMKKKNSISPFLNHEFLLPKSLFYDFN